MPLLLLVPEEHLHMQICSFRVIKAHCNASPSLLAVGIAAVVGGSLLATLEASVGWKFSHHVLS